MYPIISELAVSYLRNCLPESTEILTSYSELLNHFKSFDQEIQKRGQLNEENSGISSFVDSYDIHFAHRLHQQALTKARKIILSQTWSPTPKLTPDGLPTYPIPDKVSPVANALVEMVTSIFNQFHPKMSLNCASILIQCCKNIFHLFQSITETQFQSQIDHIQEASTLFFNDCTHMALCLRDLATTFHRRLPKKTSRKSYFCGYYN